MSSGPDPREEQNTAPLHVAPPSAQPVAGGVAPDHSVAPASIGSTASDACPTCGQRMAPDQRYCLECGHRRGDPRLPFMDAVVFMDSVKRPGGTEAAAAAPPPPSGEGKSGGGFSPQATLIAGVATLVLAVGVGVLIGQSGNDPAPVAESPTKIIKVGGTGGGEETETATAAKGNGAKKEAAKSGGKKSAAAKKGAATKEKDQAPELEEGDNGGSKASEEVLHTSENAKPQAKATAQVGEKCDKGSAGCSDSGEFNGSFFGE